MVLYYALVLWWSHQVFERAKYIWDLIYGVTAEAVAKMVFVSSTPV